eukprot:157249_1
MALQLIDNIIAQFDSIKHVQHELFEPRDPTCVCKNNDNILKNRLPPIVIICPGNGCTNIRQSNWYGHLQEQLKERDIKCICENFPDPFKARRKIWLPFIDTLITKAIDGDTSSASERIILVGHSSGAQAALRYAETTPIRAVILVSATYSDLGDKNERQSGYYPQPAIGSNNKEVNAYDFNSMKQNCKIWHQFHSDDDPFIPLYESDKIANGLGLSKTDGTYRVLHGRSHFFESFPELLEAILSLC